MLSDFFVEVGCHRNLQVLHVAILPEWGALGMGAERVSVLNFATVMCPVSEKNAAVFCHHYHRGKNAFSP